MHAGKQNGVETQVLTPEQVREMAPAISDRVTSALVARAAGIICPVFR